MHVHWLLSESRAPVEQGRGHPCKADPHPVPLSGTNRISRPCSCPRSSSKRPSPSPWLHWTTWPRLDEARSSGALANQARVRRDMSWLFAAAEVDDDEGCCSEISERSVRTTNNSANHSLCSPPARGLLDFMSVAAPPPLLLLLLLAFSRTSTTTIHAQCSLPDLNHDHPRPVFAAGPQP